MEFINTVGFIQVDFLLQSKTAKQLYFQYAEAMPIIDYHNHLPPDVIAKNQPFKDIILWGIHCFTGRILN